MERTYVTRRLISGAGLAEEGEKIKQIAQILRASLNTSFNTFYACYAMSNWTPGSSAAFLHPDEHGEGSPTAILAGIGMGEGSTWS